MTLLTPGCLHGSEDLFALIIFVDHVSFLDDHAAHNFIRLTVNKGYLLPLLQPSGLFLCYGECDGNGPEDALRRLHVLADSPPIRFSHETFQWTEGPDPHHDQVIPLPGSNANHR